MTAGKANMFLVLYKKKFPPAAFVQSARVKNGIACQNGISEITTL
jgi:hypothetical protein